MFLPGEREIREAAEALRKHALARPGLSTAHAPEILPLFSRLSAGDQDRIFKPSGGQRRIVLATNVAETSLTVPGIRYVIDTGLARVKRYSYRNKVEQLQVERISQAAARQRAGRCGRVAAGVCVRLYDEADFTARPPFTDPEILRSSLAGVILRMKSLKLTDVESFPFIEPPPAKAISDGYALLQELGGLDDDNKLTRSAKRWPSCRSTRASAACWSRRATSAASRKSWSSPPACRYRIRASGRRSASRRLTKSTSCSPTRSRNSSAG